MTELMRSLSFDRVVSVEILRLGTLDLLLAGDFFFDLGFTLLSGHFLFL